MGSHPRRLAAAAAAVAALALAAAPAAATTPSEALTILNQLRGSTGIPAVQSMDAAKNDGCAKHNHYMAQNNTLTHTEENGNPGYTPEGANAGSKSVLAQPQSDPTIWVDSVFHRIGMLQPRLIHSGFAASEGYTCMWTIEDVSNTTIPSVKTYPWPPNGSTNIATTFTSNESPDPYDVAGTQSLGYLLSVNMDGPWFDHYSTHVKVASASLVTAGGSPAQITVVDSETPYQYNGVQIGQYLPAAFALFPHGELKPATTYTAHAQGVVTDSSTDYPFNVTWHFKTGGNTVPGKATLKLGKGKIDGNKVHFKLTAGGPLVGRTATVKRTTKKQGKPKKVKKTTLKLKAKQTLTAKKPPKHGSVKFKVTTAPFVKDGVSYSAASATSGLSR
ncbi:MAG: hypothetical protein QOI65_1619 [Thermoleophilaceae bacterium]|nr:hypothetical protein [Thermoleophilaceae bacterium]